jgi:hypothetical protein
MSGLCQLEERLKRFVGLLLFCAWPLWSSGQPAVIGFVGLAIGNEDDALVAGPGPLFA